MSQKARSPREGKAAATRAARDQGGAKEPEASAGELPGAEAARADGASETPGAMPEETVTSADAAPSGPDITGAGPRGAADPGGPDAASNREAEWEAAQRRIAELEADLDAARDRQLRALAELENLRKRAERERAENARYGGVRLARDLLAAQDAFDRLLLVMDDSFRKEQKQFADGVELIHKTILGAFEKHDIRPIAPERNDAFDPHLHQAMFKEIDDDIEPGRIVRVLENGFRLGDRLLRAARVSLADERVIAAKKDPPPSMPVPGEDFVDGEIVDPMQGGTGAAGDGGLI